MMNIPNKHPLALAELTQEKAQEWFKCMSSYDRDFIVAILRASPEYRYENSVNRPSPEPGLPSAIVVVEAAVAQLEATFIDGAPSDWPGRDRK